MRANQYFEQLDPIAQTERTVAVLRVKQNNGRCIDIVGSSGNRVLEPAQRRIRLPNESFAHKLRNHAEETVIASAKRDLSKNRLIALGVSRTICPEICQPLIYKEGGTVLPSLRGATWP